MNFSGNNFEGFGTDSCNTNRDNSSQDENSEGCYDIPGGFQDLDPNLFLIVGAILGDALAGKLPFNVQNALGNWFELVGQIILTYNAQQQYQQSGPGRYYNPMNKNVTNPFCTSSSSNNSNDEADDLKKSIHDLKKQVEKLNKEIEHIKKSK